MNADCTGIYIGLDTDNENLSTHYEFIIAFLTAFFLNWLGYIATFFINDSIATRSGGVSGFGLSIVKVALIVQHVYEKDESFLTISSMIIVGISLFMYGMYNYFATKN